MRPREEVERLWREGRCRLDHTRETHASINFVPAPGDRGTEVHVELANGAPADKVGGTLLKLIGTEPLAKVKDELRRFKQLVETGVIARSEGSPEGESLSRKLHQRPAQPFGQDELQKLGV
jgi:hypothetical protein